MALGDQDNPYIANTWDDLVTYCAESGVYVKLGANINALDEYSDGTIPQLTVACAQLDGDGKVVSNIYRSGSTTVCISVNSSAKLINCNFTNIYSTGIFISCDFNNPMPLVNCKFAGITTTYFIEAEHMRSCSFNVDSGSYPVWFYFDSAIIQDCRFKIKTTSNYLFANGRGTYSDCSMYNCYVEANAPNYSGLESQSSNTKYDNCAFDITTNHVATFNPSYTYGGYSVSIVNQTHGPNISVSGMARAIADSDWLNVSALQAVGFKIY